MPKISQIAQKYKMKEACSQRDIECLPMSCVNCRHGLCLSRTIYCTLLQEKIDSEEILPEYCHYFEPEPIEYKLFRRT